MTKSKKGKTGGVKPIEETTPVEEATTVEETGTVASAVVPPAMVPMEQKDLLFEQIEYHDVMLNFRESYPDIAEMMSSLLQSGLRQPVTVWAIPLPEPQEMPWGVVPERYFLIAGFRRMKAIGRIKTEESATLFKEVPCVVYRGDIEGARLINITENVQRSSLSPLEVGEALRVMHEEHGMTQVEMAERLGKTQPWVSRTLDFVVSKKVSDELKKAVRNGLLPFWFATEIGQMKKEKQIQLAKRLERAAAKGPEEHEEELKKLKKEVKQKNRQIRTIAEIKKELHKWFEMDSSALTDAQAVHRSGILKGLAFSLDKDVKWEEFDPEKWFDPSWVGK